MDNEENVIKLLPRWVNAQFLARVKVHRLGAELVRREHVDDLANVRLRPGDELIDDALFEFQSFLERDRHDAGPHFLRRRSLEQHLERRVDQGFHLLTLAVVGDGNDRDLGLFEERVERADPAPVARRHAVNLVHDDQRLVVDAETALRTVIVVTTLSLEEPAQSRIGHLAPERLLEQALAPRVGRVQLEDIEPEHLGDEVRRRRLADPGRARDQHAPERVHRVRTGLLEPARERFRPVETRWWWLWWQ